MNMDEAVFIQQKERENWKESKKKSSIHIGKYNKKKKKKTRNNKLSSNIVRTCNMFPLLLPISRTKSRIIISFF